VGGAGNIASNAGIRLDRNQPLPVTGYNFDPAINTGLFPYANAPYPGYAAIDTFTSGSKAKWNGLVVSARHAFSQHFFLSASYTWSHGLAEDRSTGIFAGSGTSTQDIYHPLSDYGSSLVNVPHLLAISYIWELPGYKSGLRGALFGGWKYSGITTIQSGFTLDSSLSVSNQGLTKRPNLIAPISYPKTTDQWFSVSSFARPANGFFGTAGTGILHGPGLVNFDMALYKEFRLNERNAFEFRGELFNIFNHTNFEGIGTAFGSGTFGKVTSARDPRIVELALRYRF
jgi:hypothetical protein